MSTLDRILEEAWNARQSGQKFLAVFDLDSTLLDLTLRVSSIVDQFAEDAAQQMRFPMECKALKTMKYSPKDWGLEEPLTRAGIAYKGHEDFYHALHSYWAEGFFSNDYLHHDIPLPGAVTFVQELHQIGANIMYLTARDYPRMGAGTEKSLRECDFPMDNDAVELVLKPSKEGDDAQFKLEVLQKALTKYDRIWFFENEPVNLNLVAKNCPEIELVFIDSTHSGREQVDATLKRIEHFEVDLSEFRRRMTSGERRHQ